MRSTNNPKREELSRDIAEFLAAGGKIEHLESGCILFRDAPSAPKQPRPRAQTPAPDDPHWRPIPGWPRYLAHPDGHIYSLHKRGLLPVSLVSKKVRLQQPGGFIRLPVAELVALTFGDGQ